MKNDETVLMEGILESIQVGKVRQWSMPENVRVDFRHPTWTSGIFKHPVAGSVRITEMGVEGDEQTDLGNHGGPDNVVLAYDAAHYPQWRQSLGMPDLAYGGFGENFTVSGLSDHDVCIGDAWRVGEGDAALLQVTQARQPCFKLARRLQQPHIVKMVHESSWGGWYLRVLRRGGAGRHGDFCAAAATPAVDGGAGGAGHVRAETQDTETARELAALPELSERWKRELFQD